MHTAIYSGTSTSPIPCAAMCQMHWAILWRRNSRCSPKHPTYVSYEGNRTNVFCEILGWRTQREFWEPASQRSSEVMCRLIWQTDLAFDVFFSPVTRTHPTSQNRRLQIIRAGFFESAVNATSSTSQAPSPNSDRTRRQ